MIDIIVENRNATCGWQSSILCW